MSVTALDDLVMYVGVRAPNADAVMWLEREVLQACKPHRGAYMHVLVQAKDDKTEATREATGPTRQAMQHFVQACGPKFVVASIVIQYEGFVGAAVRSIFSAVLLAARPEIPVKMFGAPGNAIAWTASQARCALPDAARVDQEVARLCAAMR